MPAKLSEREKKSKGTAQRCRAREARSLRVIRREMRELRQVIKDMVFNVRLARKCIRADGTLIETLVTNSNGEFQKSRKLNPSFKIQMDAMTALKSLNRQMDFLCEEREAAEAKQQKAEGFSEFRV
jgi:hypothetical protein